MIFIALLSLASCIGVDIDVTLPSELGDKISTKAPSQTVQVERIEIVSSTPTAVFLPQVDETSNEGQNPPTAAPDPLRFVFPDSKPDPVSAWRPPLYPVPWAPTPNDHFYFSRPIAADEVNWPLANYRYGGCSSTMWSIRVWIFPASKGTPVIAAGDGKVFGLVGVYTVVYLEIPTTLTGRRLLSGMILVTKDTGCILSMAIWTGLISLLGSMSGMGDQLGLVGDTGFVTGPHLHFEVRVGESDFFKTLNPELWLVPPRGWGMVAAQNHGYGWTTLFRRSHRE